LNPNSIAVGTSGNAGVRSRVETANARSRFARMSDNTVSIVLKAVVASPLNTAVAAAGPPL
jgi:hypothetical protein